MCSRPPNPLMTHSPSSTTSVTISAVNQTTANDSSRRFRIRPARDSPASPNSSASTPSNGDSTMTPRAMTITIGASTSRRTSLGGSTSTPPVQ